MTQYIDKDDLVAEIKKIRCKVDDGSSYCNGWQHALRQLEIEINTIEVKENDLLTEEETEKELAESYINLFDKKFGDKLPNLKGKHLAEFKNFINTCEQIFHLKYFDYHATQGKLFEKLALLWAAWGKEHLSLEVKEVDLEEEIYDAEKRFGDIDEMGGYRILIFDYEFRDILRHFFELGLKTKGE